MKLTGLAAALSVCLLAIPALAAEDLESGLARLWDLDRLLRPVDDGERALVFAGTAPQAGQAGEIVLAEHQGPGCVTRIWAATPPGVLRVYVDGQAPAVIEEKAASLLGGRAPFLPTPLAGEHAGGASSYLPIPFAKSFRITCDRGGFAFAIRVTAWPDGTKVTPLTSDVLRDSAGAISAAADRVRAMATPPTEERGLGRSIFLKGRQPDGEGFLRGSGMQTEFIEVSGPPGKPSVLFDLWLTHFACNDVRAALARVMVVVHIDGVEAVRAPLGGFFGCGPGGAEHLGAVTGLVKDEHGWAFYNRLPMPFAAGARIEIENRSGHDFSARLAWSVRSAKGPPQVRLHAVYTEHSAQGPVDAAPVADVRGNGRLVGVTAAFRTSGDGVGRLGGTPTIHVGGNSVGADIPGWFGFDSQSVADFVAPFELRLDHGGDPMVTTRFMTADALQFTGSLKLALRPVARSDATVDLATTVFVYTDTDPDAAPANAFPADATPGW